MINSVPVRKENLVSIIMPAYNCSDFISISIDSVIKQTYENWELIIVNDCSSDNTEDIIINYLNVEGRIKYHKLDKNSGAAIARNVGVENAEGEYIAFLDSDDIWFEDKLHKQINFMEKNNYNFSCTSYTKINEYGQTLNRIIGVTDVLKYDNILTTPPGNSTVIYNAKVLGKFTIPDIKKRNDYVMWLQIIKKAKVLYGVKIPLASHRIRSNSLSSNKFSLISYHWKVYREIEELSLLKSSYLIIYWISKSLFKMK